MATYALITGDEFTKFAPLAFVYNSGDYEVICQSLNRKNSWYSFLDANKNQSLESILTRFSYQNVKTGEVTPEIEKSLNGLRIEFANQQIQELETKPVEDGDR